MTTELSKKQLSRVGARKIMKKIFGKLLPKNHVVHHIDNNPFNNDLSNLLIMSNEDHIKLHSILKRTITFNYRLFSSDGQYFTDFNTLLEATNFRKRHPGPIEILFYRQIISFC